MYASTPGVGRAGLAARGIARSFAAALIFGALALVSACHDTPTANRGTSGPQPVNLKLRANIGANPGAVLAGELSFTAAGGARQTLARGSLVITTDAAEQQLSLTADVSSCTATAAANGSTCTVNLALTLTRDGRLLDESNQQFQVSASTQNITVPVTSLFEVATVAVDTAGTGALEPGDTKTLAVVGRDRTGVVVLGRNPAWSVVSGGVTVTAAGVVTAVTEGAATVRVLFGGRSADLTLQIGPTSVASIDIAPADTSVAPGGTFSYRVTPRSSTGAALTGRTVTLSTSSAAIATIAGNLATGVSAGVATITATSTQGRGGATVTKTTTLRVLATPAIRVSQSAVTFDVALKGTSAPTSVAVTTDTGRTISGLVSSVTYSPAVAPWLTQSLAGTVTPTTLSLQAAAGALDTGTYTADVSLKSTVDAHIPVTVRITMHVVRLVAAPHVVTFGPYSPNTPTFPPSSVTLRTSLAAVPLSGLTVRTEYIGSVTGWLQTALQSTTAAPSTSVLLTPNPTGVPAGTNQARVIVTSATPVISADTIVVSLVSGSPGRFSGLVVNATNQQPIPGVSVVVRRLDNSIVDQVTTAPNGTWTSNDIVAGTYNVTVSANGFQDYVLYSQVLVGAGAVTVTPLANLTLVPTGTNFGTITGSVRDATNNVIIVGATVELRAGANNVTGTPLATTITNSDGEYQFQSRQYGVYTVRATSTGYAAGSVTISVVTTNVRAPIAFLSPGSVTIAWRFVLSWGATPYDLDAHLTGPIMNSANRFHVYWASEGSVAQSPFAALDVDALQGYGPETITLYQQIPGVYRFYVNNFDYPSNGVPELRASNARVDVYKGNTLVRQFFPPQLNGKYWAVFEIDGPVLIPLNTIGGTPLAIRAPAVGPVNSNMHVEAALQELLSFPKWPLTKPGAPVRRD